MQIQSIRWYTWPSEFVRVLWRSFARDFKEGSAAAVLLALPIFFWARLEKKS